MQHISLTESYDLVPLRCPSCQQLVCERVGKLQSDRAVTCRVCQAVASVDQLVANDPALGRILRVQGEIRVMRGAA